MDNFNKMFSFILGLIVVTVFLAVFTKRLNIGQNISRLTGKKTAITPTTAPLSAKEKAKERQSPLPAAKNTYTSPKPGVNKYQNTKAIPATGSPTALLLLASVGLIGGIYLKNKSS